MLPQIASVTANALAQAKLANFSCDGKGAAGDATVHMGQASAPAAAQAMTVTTTRSNGKE